jgi:hypothetical protein
VTRDGDVERRDFLRKGGLVAAGAATTAAAVAIGTAPSASAVSVNVPIYVALDHPIRSFDSRSQTGPLSPGFVIVLTFTGLSDAGIVSATWNITVTQTQGAGYLALFPGDINWPGNSSINWSLPNLDLANNGFVRIPDGTTDHGGVAGHKDQVIVLCGGTGPTQFILDAVGNAITTNFVATSTTVADAFANPTVAVARM